jgi:periplasmic binding family protein
MPDHHHPRPRPQPRHVTRTIAAAASAAVLLTLAACTSTSTTGSAASAVAVASNGPDGQAPTLTGAGSTFDAPFFSVAFARYQQQHPDVTISYSAVGSSAGIAAFSAGRADFGASDVPMTASEQAAATGGPVTQVPVALGGEGIAYNLPLPAGARLHLTGPVLARIYLGRITRWNDPALTALNPGITLPPAAIHVMHRSDGSGTTYIFSDYLSSVSRPGPPKRAPASPSATSSRPTPKGCSCRSPPSATRPGTTSPHQPGPSPPMPPANPPSPPPTSPSSASPAPTATPSADTAGYSSTPASTAWPPVRLWSPCSTGSPTTARPTPPPTVTSHCRLRSASSPAPPSSK